ncbi:zinc ribbon domain-containing protein [Streptomyces sp. NPDC026673]|uniref:zinc ribbon domain-containing protein n=1 Tax=Streptomyces sp. NPDC026673 TaxID=3155724 RepID=UPI003407578C
MLRYQTEHRGRGIVWVGCRSPSSQICSECGDVMGRIRCTSGSGPAPGCGTLLGRYGNAARNVHADPTDREIRRGRRQAHQRGVRPQGQ